MTHFGTLNPMSKRHKPIKQKRSVPPKDTVEAANAGDIDRVYQGPCTGSSETSCASW
jgi:hypothetical protein